ncbi:MAG: hypothetical protein V3U88_08495 [Methylococcales bacterium]
MKPYFALILLLIVIDTFAAGSTVKNSTIINKVNIKHSRNIAIGKAEANQGSVLLKGAQLKNSTVVNNARIKNSNNLALGFGGKAEANQGVVKISKSLSGVKIVNEADISHSTNVAIEIGGIGKLLGTNQSSQGSIIIK